MTDERLEAKAYWASLPFASYHQDGPRRRIIVDVVRELGREQPIQYVFREFRLQCRSETFTSCRSHWSLVPRVIGLDINEAALEDGRKTYGLDLRDRRRGCASQSSPDDEFDCAFTVSVFEHMAEH